MVCKKYMEKKAAPKMRYGYLRSFGFAFGRLSMEHK